MMLSYTYIPNDLMHSPNNTTSSNMNIRYSSSQSPVSKPEMDDSQTEEIATFLLSLKHSRSVSPEPPESEQVPEQKQQEALYSSPISCSPSTYDNYANRQYQTPVIQTAPTPNTLQLPSLHESTTSSSTSIEASKYDWNQLLDGSPLVLLEDRDLVPDALFVAMAQMKVCYLTQPDRVGCYKEREIGFVGMCCKHCGGQPGFGRYYPNSVRSLAQTTTSQTILKHIGGKCRYTPSHIRLAVLQLQQEQAIQEGMMNGRPRYGSRKVFFQRLWTRLHGKNAPSSSDDDMVSKVSCNSSMDAFSYGDTDDRSTTSGYSDMEQLYSPEISFHHQHKRPLGKVRQMQHKRMKVVGSIHNV